MHTASEIRTEDNPLHGAVLEAATRYLSHGWQPVPIARICPTCSHAHYGPNPCTFLTADPTSKARQPCRCTAGVTREASSPTKAPSMAGWETRTWTASVLPAALHTSDNLGLLLGAPSGGLVDIDIDSPEALAIAPAYLPPTDMLSGRSRNPASHWWYVLTDAPNMRTERFKYVMVSGGKNTTLIELRAIPC